MIQLLYMYVVPHLRRKIALQLIFQHFFIFCDSHCESQCEGPKQMNTLNVYGLFDTAYQFQ